MLNGSVPLRAALTMIAAVLLTTPGAASAAVGSEPYRWGNVAIVAGGFMPGIVFHPTAQGVAYARSDMGGAYRLDPVTRQWIPITDFMTTYVETGVESIALDPQDPQRVYLECGTAVASWAPNGFLLRSTNQGATFERIALPFKVGGNDDGRGVGERLAVDPLSPNVLYLGSRQAGLWRSTDSGSTWNQVATFPLTDTTVGTWPNIGLGFVLFDPRTSPAGGPTQVIYVGAATSGGNLYRSTDGGATWALVPGQPTATDAAARGSSTAMMPHHGVLAANGALYLTYSNAPGPNGATDGEVYRYATGSGTWTRITPDKATQGGFAGLAVDPGDPAKVMVTTLDRWWPGDNQYRSVNGGSTWTSVGATAVRDSSVSPYLRWGAANDTGLGAGNWEANLQIDPFNADRALYVTGATVWGCDDLTNADLGQPTHWTVRGVGIEQTAVLDLVSPPSGPPLFSALGDIGGFVHADLTVSPAGGMLNPRFTTTTGVDCAELAPSVLVRVGNGQSLSGCWSSDAGATWSTFTTAPVAGAANGSIGVNADGTVIIWTANGAAPRRTTDHGATWSACTGLTGTNVAVVSDRVDPASFYAFSAGTLYRSTDGGASFSPGALGLPNPGNGKVRAVPGLAGNLWLPAHNWNAADGLYRSIDGGASFSKLGTVDQADTVGFGKAAPGQSHPAIFLVGKVQGVYGVFRSDDIGATWLRINDDLHHWGDIGTRITGDLRTWGRFYLATNGRGIIRGDRLYPGTVGLATTTATVPVSAGHVSFTVQRTGGKDGNASVTWSTADGTGAAGTIYTAGGGTCTWSDQDASSRTITVPLIDDHVWGGADRTFTITLASAAGAALGTALATVTVVDDDPPPPPTVSAGPWRMVALPGAAPLSGSVAAPDGGTPTASWSLVGGPGPVVIADPTAPSTTATFVRDGLYQFALAVHEDVRQATASTNVLVTLPGTVATGWNLPGYAEQGSWYPTTGVAGAWSATSRYAVATGSATATWTLSPRQGWYEVAVWIPAHPSACPHAVYTVFHGNGSNTQVIDQTAGAPRWVSLGLVPRRAAPLQITVGGTGGRLRVDAARAIAAPGTLVENGAPGYGEWNATWTTDPVVTGNASSDTRVTGVALAKATWSIPQPGLCHLFLYRLPAVGNASSWQVDAGEATAPLHFLVEPRSGPPGWIDFGRFRITTQAKVTLSQATGAAAGTLRADAVRLVPDTELPTGATGYVESGTGWSSGSLNGSAGTPCRETAAAGAAAVWRVGLPAGNYRVWLWRIGAGDNASTFTATVPWDRGQNQVVVDAHGPSGWVSLGSYPLNGGVSEVRLERSAAGMLRADTVRWEPLANPAPVTLAPPPPP